MSIDSAPRRTKTYIAFDGDADLMSYRTIQGWSADPKNPFDLNDAHEVNNARDDSLPESIIRQLKERLDVSKHVVLIIGSQTNKNRKGILQYEIGYALRCGLPIILVFKGYTGSEEATAQLWQKELQPRIPKVLRETTVEFHGLVCPFTQKAVVSAIQTYSNNHLTEEKGYTWYWK